MNYRIIFLLSVFIFSCTLKDSSVGPNSSTRTFYMGFTPIAYDVTTDALDYTYNKIKSDADIICHYFDDGIPWEESLFGLTYDSYITNDWQVRKSKTQSAHKVIVSVTPINQTRNGIALLKRTSGNLPLPISWGGYNFNNPNVKSAYLNYCKRVIDFFNPDYFVMGTEVNLLINEDVSMSKWNAFLDLQQFVYGELKKIYPNLPMMVSLSATDLLIGYTNAINTLQARGLSDILSMTDFFALSLYPYKSVYLTESLPSNFFELLFAMTSKPVCITETAYPALTVTTNSGSKIYNGTSQKQSDYFQKLFTASDKYNIKFIINFALRDFDKVWQASGSPDDATKILRDSGFYDKSGNVRSVYETWKNKLNAYLK